MSEQHLMLHAEVVKYIHVLLLNADLAILNYALLASNEIRL